MSTPLTLSRLAAGTWKLTDWNWQISDVVRWLEQCIELGVTTIDLADIYGSYRVEAFFGQALRQQPVLRQQLQLVSKCGIKLLSPQRPAHQIKSYDTSREHIVASVDQSLHDLGCDYLDLLLIHRPDPLMNAEEVADAVTHLKQQGKIREFGVSNFTPTQFELLNHYTPLFTNQIQCSLTHLEPLTDGSLDQAQRLRRSPMIWSPVGSGNLFRSPNERETRLREKLAIVASQHDVTPSVIAIAWLLRHPAKMIPIIGSSKIERYRDAAQALSVELTREQWHLLWSASLGKNVP